MLCSRKNLITKKIWRRGGGGGVSEVSVETFLSHFAEKFVGEPISVSLFLGIDNFYASEG